MNMDLMKKKKKKGFTLIELIVVIAIIGILAAIAIPRMAGFTDKAKISADKQYGALVGNSALTLLADDTFTSGGEIEIAKDGTVSSPTAAAVTGFTAAKIEALTAKKALKHYASMKITLDAKGAYTVTYTE